MDSASETLIREAQQVINSAWVRQYCAREWTLIWRMYKRKIIPGRCDRRLGAVKSMMGPEKGLWGKRCSVLSSYGQRYGTCLWDLTFVASLNSLSGKGSLFGNESDPSVRCLCMSLEPGLTVSMIWANGALHVRYLGTVFYQLQTFTWGAGPGIPSQYPSQETLVKLQGWSCLWRFMPGHCILRRR